MKFLDAASAAPPDLVLANDLDDADLAARAADLAGIDIIALDFPKWVDGRAYSQAHLLRTRYRFTGEIRAIGEVVADMLPMLARTGFDAVVLRADQDRATAERALGFFPDGYYQGDLLEPKPRFARAAPALSACAGS